MKSRFRQDLGNEDFEDTHEVQPYSIVIQLAKGKHIPSNYAKRERTYDRDPIPVYASESEYIDDEEDTDSRMFNINNKKVQIKVNVGT